MSSSATATASSTSGAGGTEGFFFASSTTEGFVGVGNYPDPAVLHCGELPAGVPEGPGLMSAFAVRALAGAQDVAGNEVEAGTLRVRLANRPLVECGDSFEVEYACDSDDCPWGIAFSLSADEQAVGVYSLADLAAPRYEVAVPGPEDEVEGAEGTIEILRVSPGCIVGEIRGVPGRDGGFVAQVCDSQCVPMPGQGC